MTPSIDAALAIQRLHSQAAGDQAHTRTGSLQGHPVAPKEGVALLADAAEEISSFMSARVGQQAHGQRRVRPEPRLRAMTLEQISAYLEKVRKPHSPEDLLRITRRLLQNEGRDALALARATPGFQGPTEHYLLLQSARHTAQAEGASARTLARLDEALSELASNTSDTIEAMLATVDQAASHGPSAQDVTRFQASLETLLDKPSLHLALQEVLTLAGQDGARLEGALGNLMNALGACLATRRAISEKALLQTLITDLYHLKSIRTLLDDCKALLRKSRHWRPGGNPGTEHPHALAQR